MDGFLKGLPQLLNNTSYDFLNSQEGCFIRINTIKLNKHLDIPLTNKNDETSGVRDFTNDMKHGTLHIYIYIYIDNIGL